MVSEGGTKTSGRRPWALLLAAFSLISIGLLTRLALPLSHAAVLALVLLVLGTTGLITERVTPRTDWDPVRRGCAFALGALVTLIVVSPTRGTLTFRTPLYFGLLLSVGVLHLAIALVSARANGAFARPGIRERLEAIFPEFLPRQLAKVAAAETTVLLYALFWWIPPDVPAGARSFTYHREIQFIFAIMIGVAVVETILTHLVLHVVNRTADLIFLAVSELSIVYLFGLLNSLRKLPNLVSGSGVTVRMGLLLSEFVPFSVIDGVDPFTGNLDRKDRTILKAAVMAHPNILITLKSPIAVKHAFRGVQTVSAIALHSDDAPAFRRAFATF